MAGDVNRLADDVVSLEALQTIYAALPESQRAYFLVMTLTGSIFDLDLVTDLSRQISGRHDTHARAAKIVLTTLQEKVQPPGALQSFLGGVYSFRPAPEWFLMVVSQLAQHASYEDLVRSMLAHQSMLFETQEIQKRNPEPWISAPYSLVALLFMATDLSLQHLFRGRDGLGIWLTPQHAARVLRALRVWPRDQVPTWGLAADQTLLTYLLEQVPPHPALNRALFQYQTFIQNRMDPDERRSPSFSNLDWLFAERRLLSGDGLLAGDDASQPPERFAALFSLVAVVLGGRLPESADAFENLADEPRPMLELLGNTGSSMWSFWILFALAQHPASDRSLLEKAALHFREQAPILGSFVYRLFQGMNAPHQIIGRPWYEHRRYFGARPEALHVWLYTFVATWLEIPNFSVDPLVLKTAVANLDAGGLHWPKWDLSFLTAYRADDAQQMAICRAALADLERVPLIELMPRQEPWEMVLKELDAWRVKATASDTEPQAKPQTRLVWVFDLQAEDGRRDLLFARHQKYNAKRDAWSKGRLISCLNFVEKSHQLEPLSEQDRRLQALLLKRYHEGFYRLGEKLGKDVFQALVGHPLLFETVAGDKLTATELQAGQVQIQVVEEAGHMRLTLAPEQSLIQVEDVMLTRDGPQRLVFYPLDDHLRGVRHILQRGVVIPTKARDQLKRTLNELAPLIPVQSDLELDDSAREVTPDHRLYLLLTPMSDVLSVQPAVMPFGDQGPWFQPGSPGRSVSADVKGEKLRTRRDQAAEKAALQNLFRICPSLFPYQQVAMPWVLDSLEDCLELLDDLERIRDQVTVSWPEGQSMRLAGIAHLGNASLRIKHSRDWFAVEGQVQINEDMVVGLQELLTLIGDGKQGRFVALEEGRFLSLSHEFLKRLQTLRNLSQSSDRKRLRYSLSAALSMAPVFEGVADFQGDAQWQSLQQRFHEVQDQEIPVPSTLDGDLRDYQVAGYRWLARLAHCGLGACLADDMGLGKTIQAITLLLRRAPDGPALVLAPTSVCHNWEMELRRFAPTLQPLSLGDEQREKVVEEAGAFDVLVVSHGLLPFVGELLQTRTWHSVVFDEAQAIKNAATQRAKTARALQADFRMITTGTPIENHLGELWSLFQFINPGLLGNRDAFNKRFAGPIERQSNREVQKDLQVLVRPFILRRLKRDVLSALPPRTEIELQVELSEEERSVYEALRRDAVDRISRLSPGKGNQYLEVLANLMRLRRGVCHPRMVLPEWDKGSAKLRMLGSILDELKANHHRALIFSQFVDHLHLIRDYLEDRGMPFQYLDGSTPAKARATRVRAFQAGEGDVFLISLKAGGTGLNLTAADYVILMDPWWNPAVEDQASDRAHRMGQTRPVTIYRLVAKQTVEEKIMALHRHKRELAESLLAGTESSAPLDKDVLLRLLSEPS